MSNAALFVAKVLNMSVKDADQRYPLRKLTEEGIAVGANK